MVILSMLTVSLIVANICDIGVMTQDMCLQIMLI